MTRPNKVQNPPNNNLKRHNLVEMTNWSTLNGMAVSPSINSLRLIASIRRTSFGCCSSVVDEGDRDSLSGGPEVLTYEDAPRRSRKADEVLIRVIGFQLLIP